jgi:double-stranded RNA-binding protein Staufen
MFIINELARFNKIQLQYLLEDETGPAHNKIFFVKLKLGDNEEYKSSGTSIKKAQQAAAKIALETTKYEMNQQQRKKKEANNTNNNTNGVTNHS